MNCTSTKDFEQKRRDRSIGITNIAIEKVPRTHIPGFSNEQNEFIQNKHKELLREAQKLNKLNNTNKMEVGILIDIHTWDSWTILGRKPCEVDMKDNPLALQNLTTGSKNSKMFMHNHPSTGTFSGEDFKTFCNNDTLYMMTVIGNDASVYIMIKDTTFKAEYALIEYMKLASRFIKDDYIKNNGTLAVRQIIKNAKKYGLIYKKGRYKI